MHDHLTTSYGSFTASVLKDTGNELSLNKKALSHSYSMDDLFSTYLNQYRYCYCK